MACCNYRDYDIMFDKKLAQKELQGYLQSGLKKNSQPFYELLEDLPLKGQSLLDIGGGIGALTFELFKKGIATATHIDISIASVETFRSEVKRQSLEDKIASLHGDFLEVEAQIPKADLVILDKVICCYQDFEQLVGSSLLKARRWYVYSIPRERWLSKVYFFLFESIGEWISGKYLPFYFHSNEVIEKIITTAGFRKIAERHTGNWRIVVFQK